MRHSSLCFLFVLIVGAPLAAQQPSSQTGAATPGTISPAATQTEPLLVDTTLDNGAAVAGTNASPTGAGVQGIGRTGGVFQGPLGIGVGAAGLTGGVNASCAASQCIGVLGTGGGIGSSGLVGRGTYGVVGEALSMSYPPNVTPLAGLFWGDVQVNGNTTVAGAFQAPVIDQLQAYIAALTSRLAALEALPGVAGSVPRAVPGRVQAEAYDVGGPGVGYVDNTPGNLGGAYRNDDVDIKPSAEGDFAVGWLMAGESLAYTVRAPAAATYSMFARIGSALGGRSISVDVNDGPSLGSVAVPQMANWDQYATVRLPDVQLTAGLHVIRFRFAADWVDFQWFEVTPLVDASAPGGYPAPPR